PRGRRDLGGSLSARGCRPRPPPGPFVVRSARVVPEQPLGPLLPRGLPLDPGGPSTVRRRARGLPGGERLPSLPPGRALTGAAAHGILSNPMSTRILGISAYYHDSAACLVVDGELVAAAQEERFTRRKHDPSFPDLAVQYCLREGGISTTDLDYVVFYEKPLRKFERLLETYVGYAPSAFKSFVMAMPVWLREKLRQPNL